jgi:hypothetical protein
MHVNVWLSSTVPGYPKVQCDRIPCPDPYMGLGVQPGAPPDRTLPAQDPIGAGECLCWCILTGMLLVVDVRHKCCSQSAGRRYGRADATGEI